MSRSEFKRLFTSQGSAPLEAMKVISSSGAIRVDFDRGLRANALSMAGDLTQTKVQLPREDKVKALLSTYPWLVLVAFVGGSDFMCDVDVSSNVQLTPVSASGSGIGVPVLKKISLRVSIATFHDGQSKGSVCKVHLSGPKGQWSLFAFNLASYVATHCAQAAASDAPEQRSSAPSLSKGARPNPPNLFSKSPRYEASVLTISVERVTLSGTVKLKEMVSASDSIIAETLARDLRLPMFTFPEQEGFLIQLPPQKDSAQLVQTPEKQPNQIRSIPVVTTHTYSSPSKEQAPPEVQSPPSYQVRFVRTAEGKVTVAAKDIAKEQRQQEEQSKRELQLEIEQSREQLRAVLEEEEAGNAYRRLIEPEIPQQTDRFGVKVQEKSAGTLSAKAETNLLGIGAWDSEPLVSPPPKPLPNKSTATAPKKEVAPSRHRISYLPTRKPLFCSKLGEHVDVPPLPPTPSSLLLTSIMKRPLTAEHPTELRMLRTPPAGGPHVINGVCEGRMMGYGVGCLDIIRCGESDEDGENSEDTDDDDVDDTDDETTEDDEN